MFRTVAAVALASALWSPVAEACSCLPPTVQSSYNNADHVFSGRPIRERTTANTRIYTVRITRDGKSCLPQGRLIDVEVPLSSATCGTTFALGTHYLFFANGRPSPTTSPRPVVTTNACAGNMPVRSLTADDIDWLRARYLPCAGSCLDPSVPFFSCLIDPCTQVTPCQANATCEANYCGGCNAEFYDPNGYQVCNP